MWFTPLLLHLHKIRSHKDAIIFEVYKWTLSFKLEFYLKWLNFDMESMYQVYQCDFNLGNSLLDECFALVFSFSFRLFWSVQVFSFSISLKIDLNPFNFDLWTMHQVHHHDLKLENTTFGWKSCTSSQDIWFWIFESTFLYLQLENFLSW